MKTVKVQPAPGGWTVECDLGDMPVAFLDAETTFLEAEKLGDLYADRGRLAQAPVEDRKGAVAASSAVVGPGLSRRSR